MKRLLKKILCSLALAACLCAPVNTGGSGTNTGNGLIVGKIVDHTGSAAGGVGIWLRPSDYLQAPPWKTALTANPQIRETMTGPDGWFTIDSLPEGAYSVEANDNRGNAVLLRCSVTADEAVATLAQAALQPYAAISGKAAAGSSGARRYVQIYGLERCAAADSNGNYTLGNLPAGVYTLRIICSDTTIAPITIPAQQAISGAITQTPPAGWLYSKRIRLNTAAAGAGATGNVLNFPVLIRLTAANFDFTQSRNNGEDIRFAKSDNTFLPYEIERWDPVAGFAEVWVNVDTVYGNDSAQAITMDWGNIDAPGQSNAASVFDTGSGFLGVWHLGGSGDSVYDATGDAFNGISSGTATSTGMIGNARSFVNGNYIKIPGLLNSPGNVTLSAWVSSDTVSWGQNNNWGQEIVSLGDYSGMRLDNALGIGTTGWYQNKPIAPGPDSSFVMVNSGNFLANTGWHFIAFSINTAAHTQVLYIDGAQCASANDGNPICYTGLGSDTYIGIHGNDEKIYNFSGRIDEVRVSNISRSSDWIKLCYMNQKQQDALVKW